ncbi:MULTISPECIES: methyltransferase [Rhizobium]|uniref:methyltransferase n=1 Tax=Rhizobium TaxID=379 RepID=UPI001C82F2CE|nr:MULTISPECIES: methyltransferase [Rhizobium]MBX4899676.1 methyltransferase [Rhizobium bangladeshense]MBX5297527.1 methyltransferase [Rhizobium sp. NLR15a]MBY3617869.1 methyltransferase [Rhizobium bangladeshense]
MSEPKDKMFETILSKIRGHQLAALIHLAARWELANRIGEGRKLAEVALDLQADLGALRRVLRALAAFDIFAVNDEDFATQTAASRLLIKDAPSSLHAAAMFWGMPAAWATWGDLEYAVKTGECAFEHRFQQPLFSYLDAHPEDGSNFNRFMAISPEERHAAVVKAYDFTKFGCIADIGGGNGMLLVQILAAHPQGRGILYDRDSVVVEAIGEITALASAGRCKVIAGDFFQNVPKGADIYLLSQIVHDWTDEKALQILHNCRKAVADDTVLLLIERSLDLGSNAIHANNFLSDIEMLVLHRAAERSAVEYCALLEKSGFRIERVIGTTSPFSLIECVPV